MLTISRDPTIRKEKAERLRQQYDNPDLVMPENALPGRAAILGAVVMLVATLPTPVLQELWAGLSGQPAQPPPQLHVAKDTSKGVRK